MSEQPEKDLPGPVQNPNSSIFEEQSNNYLICMEYMRWMHCLSMIFNTKVIRLYVRIDKCY